MASESAEAATAAPRRKKKRAAPELSSVEQVALAVARGFLDQRAKPLSGQQGKSLPRVKAFHWLDLLVRSSPFPRHSHCHPAPARELTQPRPESVCSQKVTNAEITMAGGTEFTDCKALHTLLVGKEVAPGPLWGERHAYDRHESEHG